MFTQLTTTGLPGDPGNVDLTSTNGAIRGGAIDANGGVDVNAFGAIAIGAISARNGANFSSQTSLTLPSLTIGSGSVFASPIVDIGLITPNPSVTGPFELSVTGYHGVVGADASLTIEGAPSVIMDELREANAQIGTDATSFAINSGYITDIMTLTTSYERLYMNDQLSRPINGPDVQLFAPNFAFFLAQDAYLTTTSTFVVQYDGVAEIVDELSTGTILGASFVRDFDRQGRIGDIDPTTSIDELGLPESWSLAYSHAPVGGGGFVYTISGQVAVNMGDGDELWQLTSDADGLHVVVKRRKQKH